MNDIQLESEAPLRFFFKGLFYLSEKENQLNFIPSIIRFRFIPNHDIILYKSNKEFSSMILLIPLGTSRQSTTIDGINQKFKTTLCFLFRERFMMTSHKRNN